MLPAVELALLTCINQPRTRVEKQAILRHFCRELAPRVGRRRNIATGDYGWLPGRMIADGSANVPGVLRFLTRLRCGGPMPYIDQVPRWSRVSSKPRLEFKAGTVRLALV